MSRNLVVCLDGTWNNNTSQNTAVHAIFNMVDPMTTVSNYWRGIGDGSRPISRVLDGALGRGAFYIMRDAYSFLNNNYAPGDRIFIFGFSRGAWTARHLAGMIARLGFGPYGEQTYRKYRKELIEGKAPSVRQEIHFLGMFDCVPGNQLYALRRNARVLNAPALEPGICNVAHAVSRDERRWSFAPILFERGQQQRFSQCWFPGYHFDIGGDDNPPLNAFALWWMLREAYACGLDLTHIKCAPVQEGMVSHGHLGIAIGFMADIDSSAAGKSSDWITTKLGFRCIRENLPRADELVTPQPDLADLDSCSRGCDEDMFDFFQTPEGVRRTRALFDRQRT